MCVFFMVLLKSQVMKLLRYRPKPTTRFLTALQLLSKAAGSFSAFREWDGCQAERGISETDGTRQASLRLCLWLKATGEQSECRAVNKEWLRSLSGRLTVTVANTKQTADISWILTYRNLVEQNKNNLSKGGLKKAAFLSVVGKVQRKYTIYKKYP